MAGKPLRSQLNQIRAWVREGRTDAWIAHQLDISASELREFRRRHDLEPDSEPDTSDDLRDEIEAEVEAATLADAEAAEAEPDDDEDDEDDRRRAIPTRSRRTVPAVAVVAAEDAAAVAPRQRSKEPSTTATRATASGWTPPSRTTPSTPRTGRATARFA